MSNIAKSKAVPPSLFKLPPELRMRIWDMTFEPRTLTVSTQKISSLGPYAPTPFAGEFLNVPITIFVALSGIHMGLPPPPDYEMAPEDYKHGPIVFRKAPAGPIALQVCLESRHHTLKRYELSFPPSIDGPLDADAKRLVAEKSVLKEARIWIDWKADTVFFNPFPRIETNRILRDRAGRIELQVRAFGRAARQSGDELKKIRNLMIMSSFSAIWEKLFPNDPYVSASRYGHLLSQFEKFPSLKTLTILQIPDFEGRPLVEKGEDELATEFLEYVKSRVAKTPESPIYETWVTNTPVMKVDNRGMA